MQDPTNRQHLCSNAWNAFIETGDTKSLELVYNQYFDLLYNYGKKFHSENQLIEDAIQNLFIRLIKGQKHLCCVKNPHSYLICSFRNELFHLIKKSRKISLHDSLPEFIYHPEWNPEEGIIKNETERNLKNILIKSIKKLTSSQQEILYMRYDTGLSYEDISNALNITIESCRTAVYRAIKTIKKHIEG